MRTTQERLVWSFNLMSDASVNDTVIPVGTLDLSAETGIMAGISTWLASAFSI